MTFWRRIFARKTIAELSGVMEADGLRLKRSLGALDLTALGVGAMIGAGIFAATGAAAAGGPHHPGAGPALVISYLITALACGFAALCYAEIAAMIPVSGSAYTYAYAAFGQLAAWIIGWDLIIEYAVGNVAVSLGWAGYFNELLRAVGVELPAYLTTDLRTALANPAILADAPRVFGQPVSLNILAVAINLAITVILVIGIRESSAFNGVMVALKLAALAFFVGAGVGYIAPENWVPFAPNGWSGIQAGAALVFFSYIGFDAISTTAEETRNPARDLPIGIFASLGICTAIYVVVTLVLTGIVPYQKLAGAEPLAAALREVGLSRAAGIVAAGAVASTTAVLLVFQLGQARIFFSMARDGLLPGFFARVHGKYLTPHWATIFTGVTVAMVSAFESLGAMVELTNIGTLFAFIIVCAGALYLRRLNPDEPRRFRAPWFPWTPLLGILFCVYLMLGLPAITWARFGIWLAVGLVIYFAYGYRRSAKLAAERKAP